MMPYSTRTLAEVSQIADEVSTMADGLLGQYKRARDVEAAWRKLHPDACVYPAPSKVVDRYPSGVETAALRRRSMDLTRALARLRRSA